MNSDPCQDGVTCEPVLEAAQEVFPYLFGLHDDLRVYLPDLVIIAGSPVLGRILALLDTLRGSRRLEPLISEHIPVVRSPASRNYTAIKQLTEAFDTLPGGRLAVDDDSGSHSIAVRKLILHVTLPYPDTDYTHILQSRLASARCLASRLAWLDPIKDVWLAGSLAAPARKFWHPYLSDIDLFPILHRTPTANEELTITAAYSAATSPPFLYVNFGAKAGIGPLTRSPLFSLCVPSIPLAPPEQTYLNHLLDGAELLTNRATKK